MIYDINYTSRLRNYVHSNKQGLLRGRILVWSICTIMVAPSPIWRRFYLARIMILFTATVSRLILLCLEFTCVTPACNNFYKSNKKVLLGSQLRGYDQIKILFSYPQNYHDDMPCCQSIDVFYFLLLRFWFLLHILVETRIYGASHNHHEIVGTLCRLTTVS